MKPKALEVRVRNLDCNPSLAHRALEAEPATGVLLPATSRCSRATTTPSTFRRSSPEAMFALVDNASMQPIATEAGERLRHAIEAL